MTIKVNAANVGNAFSAMQNTLEPRTMVPPHVHQHEWQAVYVISGDLEFEIGGADGLHFVAPAGSYVYKPRRMQHAFWNPSETVDATYMELSSEAGFQDFIYDYADADKEEMDKAQDMHQTKFNAARTLELMKDGLKVDGGLPGGQAAG